MSRRNHALSKWLIPVGVVCAAFAFQARPESRQAPARAAAPPAMRPPLFFGEGWKRLSTPADDHNAWPVSPDAVSSPNLELKLYGTSRQEIQLVAGRGQSDLVPMNLWTGTTTSPSGVALRDKTRLVDLSGPYAKIRWVVRTSGFHQARPMIKLADGTWLVGDHATGPSVDFSESDVTIAAVHWLKLDVDRMVPVGDWVDHPNLTKVDEVGFADLMPGSGHGSGGYFNIGRIEVYGAAVKR